MPNERDDLTPRQPGQAERDARERAQVSRYGRWARPRSWATVAVAILAVIVCYLLYRHIR